MDLSRPSIAIRERSTLEIFDLTLHVFRDHIATILLLLMINAVPWVIADVVLVHVLEIGDGNIGFEVLMMLMLILSQSQIGTMLITQYLGIAMFFGRPALKETLAAFFQKSKYWIWSHGFLRMVVPILVLVGCFGAASIGWVMLLLVVALVVRLQRPFISEILLLEQPAISGKKDSDGSAITLKRRSRDLHRGEVTAGGMMAWIVGACLLVTVASSFFHLDSAIGLNGGWDSPVHYAYWPLAAWLVASFVTTFRFLHYINTRIQQEGWEISLKLMSEKQKLTAKEDY